MPTPPGERRRLHFGWPLEPGAPRRAPSRPRSHEASRAAESGPLPADTLESGFDRAAMRDQQLQDAVDRALTFPVTIDPAVSAVLPNPAADQFLGWDSSGLALENKDPVGLGIVVLADEGTAMAATSTSTVTTPLSLARAIRAAKLSAFTLSR